jgi:tetratricopeptide (TPR) repeat protein
MGEQFIPHTNTKKWLAVAGIAIVVIAIGIATYMIWIRPPKQPAYSPYNPHKETVQKLESQGAPPDPANKISYYSQLAQHYESLNQKDKALTNYLKAQSAADETGGQVVFYMPIADLYKESGNKDKARTYYQKEIDYLKAFTQQHPETQAGSDQAIKQVEEAMKSL